MIDDGWSFYWANIKVTLSEAAWGYVWGNLLAIGLALLVLIVPLLEKPAMQLGIVSYCIPVIALGPILQIIYDGGTPKIILVGAVRVLHHARRHVGRAAQRRAGDVRRDPRLRRWASRRAREGAHPCCTPESVRGAAHRRPCRDPRRDPR